MPPSRLALRGPSLAALLLLACGESDPPPASPATPPSGHPGGAAGTTPGGGSGGYGGSGSSPGTAGQATGTPLPPFRPDLSPNHWTLLRDDLPTPPWEVGLAYDPSSSKLFVHGGHLLQSYVQSSYTFTYDLRLDTYGESLAPVRPPRRCIVELAYLDGPQKFATIHGSSGHGSVPQGYLQGWIVKRSDPVGPWLLDPQLDRWEHARPSGPEWPRRVHSNIAYDPTSDALYVIAAGGVLYAYLPHANQVVTLPMPAALDNRLGYGLAFDPDTRQLAVFGGTPHMFFYGYKDGDETDNCDVVSAEKCTEYYKYFVKDDTWLLDVDEAATAGWPKAPSTQDIPAGWHPATGPQPPRGMPTWNHSRIQLHWHSPTGQMLLVQNPIEDAPLQNATTWPPVELWALDPAARTWQKLSTTSPPHFAGLAAYARREDALVVWGGGAQGPSASQDGSAMTSRNLYALRPQIPGAPLREPAAVERVASAHHHDGVTTLSFAAEPGVTYEIERAPAEPVVGAYTVIGSLTAPAAEATWTDASAGSEAHAYRVRPQGSLRWSLPAFDQLPPPRGVRAIVHSATAVQVSWSGATPPGVASHRVYRWGPGESRHLVGEVTTGTAWLDTPPDLSDGKARVYVVTAVDAAGRESGPSPMAFTLSDPPEGFDVHRLTDGRFQIDWTPQDPAHQRLQLFYQDYHCNARGGIETYLDTFAPVAGSPFSQTHFIVEAPAIDPAAHDLAPSLDGECASTVKTGDYFHARLLNDLGQPGFYSDLVSPGDPRFHAGVASP